jgi:AhpD family alkylhydroperoxidase
MSRYPKRTYAGPRELLADIGCIAKNCRRMWRIMRAQPLAPAFRERLMLAVTSVYGCRYCSWVHTREALRAGICGDEVRALLAGDIGDCPEDETVALLYAQHWADTGARPERDAVEKLERVYGIDRADSINLTLRMIRVGNLSGNTWDSIVYKLSRGKWGGGGRALPVHGQL